MRPTDLPPHASLARRKLDEETRSYRFLTYVFGGGVRSQAHQKPRDEVTPIRGASLRGQLRFWWRAANPRECGTLDALRQAEGEVWGTTSQASPVIVQVTKQPSAPAVVPVFTYNANQRLVPCAGREIAYGAFPLQPKRELQQQGEPAGVLSDYGASEFTLRFLFPPALRGDVEAALSAWEYWGGLGARTRRGFGAVARSDRPPVALSARTAQLKAFASHPRIAGVPTLAGARFAVGRELYRTALPAWKDVLGTLQRLRQGEGTGRNPSHHFPNRPGRSRWPEPDEIRRLTGQSAPVHNTPTVSVERFPRAVFGLPIVFHFQNDPHAPPDQRDPDAEPLELRPAEFERFASPLILRPLQDPQGFWPAALVLVSEPPAAVLAAGEARFPVEHRLTAEQAGAIPPLLSKGRVFTDPLARFLEELTR
jgi:CRISPR-associated protein Cmr1